ncbi:hypothetical protein [Streptomyces macrosporus]|uniref:Integral membrane protein n=1 Tax=Streptomyces macrosporus TaxID=44032 RepID=A0ABP5XGL5_9ACTN
MVRRRPVALTTAVVLGLEAVGVGVLHWVLGVMVDRQKMSLDGLDPHLMAVSTWIGGAVFGAYLLLCGFLLLRAALTDRPPRRLARILLISAAVVHGVLGAVAAALVSWAAFATLMVVLGLIVLALVSYAPDRPHAPAGAEPPLKPTTP